jgi:peptide/nickel transport system ATP-binding protein
MTTLGPQPLLVVRDLVVEFHTRDGVAKVINGVSFDLHAGETLAVLGESGSGKSVTAQAIMGILDSPPARIVSGSVTCKGRSLFEMSEEERRNVRGREIAMIFQDALSALNPVFPVGWQIAEVLRARDGQSKTDATRRAIELMDLVKIPAARARIHDYPHQFSGGMRQRVMIAMALALRPSILIADEPTTALDVTVQAQIMDLLAELRRQEGMAMILITHDLGVVADVADRIAVMYAGRIVESGPVRTIFNAAAHPYTQALLESIPRIRDDGGELAPGARRLAAIDGQPPDLATLPPGCAFHPRCGHVMERCLIERPPELDLGGRHGARCWLVAEPAAPGAQR